MKKTLIILTLFIYPVMVVCAQTPMDNEVRSLLGTVCKLRGADANTYNRVEVLLAEDEAWTPMNETGAFQEGECPPYEDIPYFGLNRLLSHIAIERKMVHTHGDFLNGEDERYNYSLYERSVRAGFAVSYTLKGREGKQWFIIIPYDKDGGGLSASISINGGSTIPFTQAENGAIATYLDWPKLDVNDLVTITVQGTRNQSFVLLNHNTRKR